MHSTGDGAGASQRREVSAAVGRGPTPGTWTVTFESQALPGTLAVFAGTLAAARLDIISAVVRVSKGRVSDSFDVAPRGDAAIHDLTAEQLAATASQALNGERDLAGELAAVRREHKREAGIEVRIGIDTDSEISTGVSVSCADRPGLLYDIASTLSRHGLRTRAVSALTFNSRASDTFRVVDASGLPVSDRAKLERLSAELERICGC
jgi:[protein-PII] uridylyltransferase